MSSIKSALLKLITPISPPYDPLEWENWPLPQRAKAVCEAWALQGFGAPASVYLFYLFKLAFYVGGWLFFCQMSPQLGRWDEVGLWWASPLAFQKAILWSMLFEIVGLGCGSGPLTARYLPPFGGILYALRRGTLKLPLFPNAPLIGGQKRGILDVSLYGGLLIALVMCLSSPQLEMGALVAVVGVTVLLGVMDRTLFLMARGEHYWVTSVCFLWAMSVGSTTDSVTSETPAWIGGAMMVQLALWFWAGISKLNAHFPTVVCVMLSNHPFNRSVRFRQALYKSFPDDLRPSTLARWMAHMGTALELLVPLVFILALCDVNEMGASWLNLGLLLAVLLHTFITSNVPLGVPIEWNVLVLYGAFVLFGEYALSEPFTPLLTLQGGLMTGGLVLFLILCTLVIPWVGNRHPHRVSFLLAMRYYAGNWPYSVWLFKGDAHMKLRSLVTPAPWIEDQLGLFYDRSTVTGVMGRVMGFRMMHLQGRALCSLLPLAYEERLSDYTYLEGEVISGLTLGWNFGDGHLHQEALLQAIQDQCDFDPGELRCVFIEAQPLGGRSLAYRIVDASEGQLTSGALSVETLKDLQPWEQLDLASTEDQ